MNNQETQKSDLSLPSLLPGAWEIGEEEIELSMQLTAYTCVSAEFYRCFRATTLDKAIRNLLAHPELPIRYRVHQSGTPIHFIYNVTWPLSRKVGPGTWEQREPRQGAAPWDWSMDDERLHRVRILRGGVVLRGNC